MSMDLRISVEGQDIENVDSFYCAVLLHWAVLSRVCLSVRLSVCLSATLMHAGRISWATWKFITGT